MDHTWKAGRMAIEVNAVREKNRAFSGIEQGGQGEGVQHWEGRVAFFQLPMYRQLPDAGPHLEIHSSLRHKHKSTLDGNSNVRVVDRRAFALQRST
jgi:hypothetical protein